MHREDHKPWRYLNVPGAPKRHLSPKKVMRRMSLTASGRLVERLNSGCTQFAGVRYDNDEVRVEEEKVEEEVVEEKVLVEEEKEEEMVVEKKEERKTEKRESNEEREVSRTTAPAISPFIVNATYQKSLESLSTHEERDQTLGRNSIAVVVSSHPATTATTATKELAKIRSKRLAAAAAIEAAAAAASAATVVRRDLFPPHTHTFSTDADTFFFSCFFLLFS